MIVRQTKNTFIRFIGEKGYIINQMTRHDRNYNETGADFCAKSVENHRTWRKLLIALLVYMERV